MEKKLILLGLLQSREMHCYRIIEFLDGSEALPVTLKKANVYRLLADMEKDGWLTHFSEQEGNRPQRKVYTVTEAGRKAYKDLLRQSLSSYPRPEFPGICGLDFTSSLPQEEVVSLLEKKLGLMEAKYRELDTIPSEIRNSHLCIEYMHRFYKHEIEWLKEVIST